MKPNLAFEDALALYQETRAHEHYLERIEELRVINPPNLLKLLQKLQESNGGD